MRKRQNPHLEIMTENPKRHAPATARNRDVILSVLRGALPKSGLILEIAAGSGEHAVHFASKIVGVQWQPTDPDPAALASIQAWVSETGVTNVRRPQRLDVCDAAWPVASADGVVCINMIHISPWDCTQALMAGAGRVLPSGGALVLYGPYKIDGEHTAPSNVEFDAWLKGQEESWGVRDLAEVTLEAEKNGLTLEKTVPMPANNFSVVFRK